MPIELTCECGKQLRLRDDLAGKKVRCPACARLVTVGAVSPVHSTQRLDVDEEAEPPRRPAIRPTAVASFDWWSLLQIGCALLVLLFSAVAVGVLFKSGAFTSSPPPLKP